MENVTTVEDFIKLLEPYAKNKKALIFNQEHESFIHMSNLSNGDLIISTKRPIGYCNRSGGYVFPTYVKGYIGVVPELDENVDLCEITLPNFDEEENPNKFGRIIDKK